MKRILVIFALISAPQLCPSMNSEEKSHPSSEWTRAQVERALRAFEIPPVSIEILVGTDFGCAGLASSNKKVIAINKNMSEITIINTSFHEAAHIKDDADVKGRFQARCLTHTMLTAYLSMLPKVFNITHKMVRPKLAFPFAYCASLGFAFIGNYFGTWFHNNAATPWAIEQGELRADKLAVEKLIELNEIELIPSKLMQKKLLEKYYGNQRTGGHPPARAEYKAMKKTLERNGFEVTKYRPEDAPNDLRIELIKNGEGVYS